MAKGDLIGHAACPCCDTQAEVNEDKNGRPLLFCRNGCRLQLFTRNDIQANGLRRKLRPVAAPASQDEPKPNVPPAGGLSSLLEQMGF